jgi:hypothetical protein
MLRQTYNASRRVRRKSQVLRGRGTFWAAMSKITLIGIEFIDENGGGPGARLRKLQLTRLQNMAVIARAGDG